MSAPPTPRPDGPTNGAEAVEDEQRREQRHRIVNRLKRIEGQVRGLQKMVDEGRDCRDILTLLSGVRSALDATGDVILRSHFDDCRAAIADGSVDIDELIRTLDLARR